MTVSLDSMFDMALSYASADKYIPPPPPVSWMEGNFVDPITGKKLILQPFQKRILRKALTMDDKGYNKYDLVIWSQPKKSGKTTIASAVGAWVAINIETPNEISCVAHDKEHSAGRIYGHMQPTLRNFPNWTVPVSVKGIFRDPTSFSSKGTIVKAITTNFEKEAGGNQGLSLWSELWAYKGERLQRLWEEMTPPPTRRFSMRWVETYAGFIGENLLLQRYYQMVFTDFTEKTLQPGVIKIWPDLPVYEIDGHILVFWDHAHRMPWQTDKYYLEQRTNLRLNAFIRLHENKWVDSKDQFITEDMWMNSVRNQAPPKCLATYALDASKNGACTALVGCRKIRTSEGAPYIETTDVHVWEAPSGKDINFPEIERIIIKLHRNGLLKPPLWYDPFQCVKMAQDLRKKGIPCKEFSQGAERVKADTSLWNAYEEGWIVNYPSPILRTHVLAAQAKEYEDGKLRMVEPSQGIRGESSTLEDQSEELSLRKIDAIVAQSMAAYKAYTKRGGGWAATTPEITKGNNNEE